MSSHLIPMTGPSSMKPIGLAEIIFTFSILLGVLCAISVSLRTWLRIRDRSFHVDDCLTWLGLISNLALYEVAAWGTTVGIGTPDSMLTMPMVGTAVRLIYWLNLTYLLAMGFTKASICSTLLRIITGTGQRKTTWAVWLMLSAVVTSTMVGLLTFLIRCDPNGRCQDSSRTISILYWIVVGVYILVDISLAVLPIFIFRGLKMKKSLKLSTGVILAMGGTACLPAVLRIPAQLQGPANTGASDRLYRIGSFILWGEIETGLGIIACCLPMLPKLLRSFDSDPALNTPGRPAQYQHRYPEYSRQTTTNNTGRQPYEYADSDEEKEINILSSFDSEGRDLPPPPHTHSAHSHLTPAPGEPA